MSPFKIVHSEDAGLSLRAARAIGVGEVLFRCVRSSCQFGPAPVGSYCIHDTSVLRVPRRLVMNPAAALASRIGRELAIGAGAFT